MYFTTNVRASGICTSFVQSSTPTVYHNTNMVQHILHIAQFCCN